MSGIYEIEMTDLYSTVSFGGGGGGGGGGGSRAGRMAETFVCGFTGSIVGGAAGALTAAITKSPAASWGVAGAVGSLTNEICRDSLGWDGN